MARVNVEQKALTDPRFRAVGRLLACLEKADRQLVEHACGLLLCVRVWDQCQERGSDVIPAMLVECIAEGLSEAMIAADLAEWVSETELRIKGAKDRCLWLSECRTAGRKGGSRGGRPGKPPGVYAPRTPTGSARKTPPTPALTLTPAPTPAPVPAPVPEPTSSALDTEQPPVVGVGVGGKSKPGRGVFTPPTLAEVEAYCRERGNAVDAERFIDFYTAKGWMVGKNRMKDWRACVRTWEERDKGPPRSKLADEFRTNAQAFLARGEGGK